MTKTQFTFSAQPVTVAIAGQTLIATPKEFSTGSVGFFLNGKVPVQVGGRTIMLQVSGSFTAIGSKTWEK